MPVVERGTPAVPQSRAGITEPAERRQGTFHQQEAVRVQREGEAKEASAQASQTPEGQHRPPQADVTLGHGKLLWRREKKPWLKGNSSPKMESIMLNPQ